VPRTFYNRLCQAILLYYQKSYVLLYYQKSYVAGDVLKICADWKKASDKTLPLVVGDRCRLNRICFEIPPVFVLLT